RTRKELQRIVPARNISQHAAFEFRVDQVRGISPITTALNAYRDTMEGFEYSFAKLKIAQLFGLQITSQNDGSGSFTGPGTAQYTADADGDGTADSAPQINLTKGPFVTELNPGEEAKVIESHTPSTETVNFLKLAIHVALRATDIPYSFFDESFTNFYGSRGGLIQYLHSCNAKVQDLQEFLDDDHRWRAGLAVEDGELVLPSGKDFSFLEWEFVPGGIPWWDSTKEVRGAAMSVAAGFSSPIRVCQETGTNFFKNIDETAECLAYAREKEVPLTFGDSTAFAPGITVEASSAN
ncbi:MAG TPA: phage portal protein, partial [Rhodospirillales bacterium]